MIKNSTMVAQFQIEKIKFNSLSDTMTLSGQLHKGSLHSTQELIVQQVLLNHILNQIQQKNPEISVNDLLVTYHNSYFTDYLFNFEEINRKRISLTELKKVNTISEYKLIRA